jgi:hypothetical protein
MPTLEDLRDLEAQNNGQSIEDLAEGGDIEPEDNEVYIEGTTGQLSLAVGGRKPDTSTFKMKGGEVKIREGQFTKGESVWCKVLLRVDEIKFVDGHDEYGTVNSTKRVHIAKPIHVERVEEDVVD